MVIIEAILSVIGVISLVVTIIRIIWICCASNTEWISNVSIIELPLDDSLEKAPSGECIFPQFFKVDDGVCSQVFLIRPNDVIIKKAKLIQHQYDENLSINNEKVIKEFNNLTPYNPLVIQISIHGIIPQYTIRWSGDYGIKQEYVFHANGRDGNVDSYGMNCRIGFWQRVRQIIGLR